MCDFLLSHFLYQQSKLVTLYGFTRPLTNHLSNQLSTKYATYYFLLKFARISLQDCIYRGLFFSLNFLTMSFLHGNVQLHSVPQKRSYLGQNIFKITAGLVRMSAFHFCNQLSRFNTILGAKLCFYANVGVLAQAFYERLCLLRTEFTSQLHVPYTFRSVSKFPSIWYQF